MRLLKQFSVYRNLHKPTMFSIKQSGIVIGWASTIELEGSIGFHVGESGRIRVTKQRRKNVHSWIKSDNYKILDAPVNLDDYKELWYSPYFTQFYHCIKTGKVVVSARKIIMANDRAYALEPEYKKV